MTPHRHAIALLFLLVPAGAQAHPHVFVDAAARFILDDAGRLAAVEIEHLYDPLVSLFVLQDLGVDPFAPMSAEDAARLGADQRAMLTDAGAFAALSIGGEEIPLGAPANVAVGIADERMHVTFTAPLAAPQALDGMAAILAIFDPVYFIAFDLTGPVTVTGGAD
jgi:ABC-type uncharacterized transport system substrate-binding protein